MGEGTNNQNENNQNQQENNQNNNQNQQNNAQNNNQQNNVETKDTLAEFMKKNGIESESELENFWTNHKKDIESKKDDLTKAQDTIKETTKQLAEERKARMEADAKLTAIKLGAKPELVDDLVIIAMNKVTDTKDINAVLTEMKSGSSEKIYFVSEDENENNGKNKNVTRGKQTNVQNNNNQNNNGNQSKYSGTMAERLLSGRKANKPFYFK